MRKVLLALLPPVLVLGGCLFILGAGVFAADGGPATQPTTWPLWDGKETVAQYAQRVRLPATKTLDLGNNVNLDLVLIPAGKFVMGSPDPKHTRERPPHEVTISQPFYLGKYAVTQRQYQQISGGNPSNLKDKDTLDNPVDSLDWNAAQTLCKKVSDQHRVAVRLPTEAEWEYACRAGTTTRYSSGDSEEDLKRVAWYVAFSDAKSHHPHPVGQKEPNKFGLYDMHGNVWQWCQDWYGPYAADAVIDPQGPPPPAKDACRVMRGGSWVTAAPGCRSTSRTGNSPERRDDDVGFRVVCAVPTVP